MKIEVASPETFFALFYVLSFAVVFILAAYIANKQKAPIMSILLVLTATSFLTITGSRLFTVPVTQWFNIVISGYSDTIPGRSAIGGVLFGIAGLLVSSRLLGLGKPVFEIYAWLTPLGLGIQKAGCFLNGCCYGISTDKVFGIQYPKGTNAHFHHWITGNINDDAIFSSMVFPVQILEMLFYFLIAFFVWRTRNFWKKSASIVLLSFMLLFLARFLTAFLRDPSYSQFNSILLGISIFQWLLLLSGIVCGITLIVYEKYLSNGIRLLSETTPSLNNSVISVLFISFGIYLFRGLLSSYEKISLYMSFFPAVLLTAHYFLKSSDGQSIRLATTSFLLLPFFMILPTFSTDSLKTKKPVKPYYQAEVKKYKRIDAGTSLGKYYGTVYTNPHEGECGTTYSTEDYEHTFAMAGGGYSIISTDTKSITTKGINVFGGVDKEQNLTKQKFNSYFIGSINPYIRYDTKWYGVGIGLHVGNLRWAVQNYIDEFSFNYGTRYSPVMPEAALRLGRKDILEATYSYGLNSYGTYPVLIKELSLGSGFGFKTDYSLRLGIAFSKIDSYPFVSGEWLINKQLGMNLKYNFGNYSNYMPDTKSKGIIVFGANYRFGFEK